MKRPESSGSMITSPKAADLIGLLGGCRYGAVAFTRDGFRAMQRIYEFQPVKDTNVLLQAGSDRNVLRHAEADGLRLLAWIARYTETGCDPLKVLIQFAIEAGVDVDPSDVDYSEE